MSKKKDNKMNDAVAKKIMELKGSLESNDYSNAAIRDLSDFKDADNISKESGKDVSLIDINKLDPAPNEWNFFPPVGDNKMIEMIGSIIENGLFNPIIVWEKDDNRYMILSGHNRVQAYKNIISVLSEKDIDKAMSFEKIPSIIYKKDEIDESKAKEIIIDTNYIQREDITKILPTIVKERMEIVRNREGFKGNVSKVVAKELNLSTTKVVEDNSIATKIIDDFRNLYFDYKITRTSVLKLTPFSKEMQQWIYDTYKDEITSKMLMTLKKDDSKEDISDKFKAVLDGPDTLTMRMEVPIELRDEVESLVNEFLKSKGFEI